MASDSEMESVGLSDVENDIQDNDSDGREDVLQRSLGDGDDFLDESDPEPAPPKANSMAARMDAIREAKIRKARAAAEVAKKREQQQRAENVSRRLAAEEAKRRQMLAAERRVQEEIRRGQVAVVEEPVIAVKKKKKASTVRQAKTGTPTRTRSAVQVSDEEDMELAHRDYVGGVNDDQVTSEIEKGATIDDDGLDPEFDMPLVPSRKKPAARSAKNPRAKKTQLSTSKLKAKELFVEDSEDEEAEPPRKTSETARKIVNADHAQVQPSQQADGKPKARRGRPPKERPLVHSPTRYASKKRKLADAQAEDAAPGSTKVGTAVIDVDTVGASVKRGTMQTQGNHPGSRRRPGSKASIEKLGSDVPQVRRRQSTASGSQMQDVNMETPGPQKKQSVPKAPDDIDINDKATTGTALKAADGSQRKSADGKKRISKLGPKDDAIPTSGRPVQTPQEHPVQPGNVSSEVIAETTANYAAEPGDESTTKKPQVTGQALRRSKSMATEDARNQAQLVPGKEGIAHPSVEAHPSGEAQAEAVTGKGNELRSSGVEEVPGAGADEAQGGYGVRDQPIPPLTSSLHFQKQVVPGAPAVQPQRALVPDAPDTVSASEQDQTVLAVTMLETLERDFMEFASKQERTINSYLASLQRGPYNPPSLVTGASNLWQTTDERRNLRRQKLCSSVDMARLELRQAQEKGLVEFVYKVSQGLRISHDSEMTTLGDILKKEHPIPTSLHSTVSAGILCPPQGLTKSRIGNRLQYTAPTVHRKSQPSNSAVLSAAVPTSNPSPTSGATDHANGIFQAPGMRTTNGGTVAVRGMNKKPTPAGDSSVEDMEVSQPAVPKFQTLAELKKFAGTQYSALELGCVRSVAVLLLCERSGGLRLEALYEAIPSAKRTLKAKVDALRENGYLIETSLSNDRGKEFKVYTTSNLLTTKR